ncbi:MAG: hypothetical protein M3292_09180 [Actinomycetota bacterium]|nr:hypothetical protein [Actinomycetota bacterium]
MRVCSLRLLLLVGALVFVVGIPAAFAVRRPRPDGTLSVRDGRGLVKLAASGSFIGRIDSGRIVAIDATPNNANYPIVFGGKLRRETSRVTEVSGPNIRFRLVGGFYRLRIEGAGVDLSAVGRGNATLDGDDRSSDTGVYSLNGADFQPLPYEPTTLQLPTQAAPG